MYFFILVNILFVLYFFSVQLKKIILKNRIDKENMTKIGILFLCYQLICCVILLKFLTFTVYFVLSQLPLFVLFSYPLLLSKSSESSFDRDFQEFLKNISMTMKMGNSFRFSVKESYFLLRGNSKRRIETLMDCVVFSQHKMPSQMSVKEKEIMDEFTKIDQSLHQSTQRVELYLERILKNSHFRHKSGQILLQLYIQSSLLMIMYIALLLFVVKNYGFYDNIKIISMSFLLFVIGIFFCFKVGRKIKWKF